RYFTDFSAKVRNARLDQRLTDVDRRRAEELTRSIDEYYKEVPRRLSGSPDAQAQCLSYLMDAELGLAPPLKRTDLIEARMLLLRVEIELRRAENARTSFLLVAAIIYLLF